MFNEAQDFYIDPCTVGNATEIQVSKIDIYFKQIPLANGNKSGIFTPGVTMYLVPTANSVPVLDSLSTAPTSRVEYNLINPSTDASQATSFKFANSSPVKTGATYAWLLAYDGDEDFVIWKDTVGEDILGTTTISTGPSGKFVGNYFTYLSPVPGSTGTTIPSGTGIVSTATSNNNLQDTTANASYASSNWRPVVGVCAKFTVFAQRYAFNGNTNLNGIITANTSVVQPANSLITTPPNAPVINTASGVATFTIPAQNYEFITFDPRYSQPGNAMIGERVWQKNPLYPNDGSPSTIAVVANNNKITSSSVNFKNLFVTGQQAEYIIVISKNHDGPGLDRALVRQVTAVESNTTILVDEPMVFTNTAANFYKAPVARIESFSSYNSAQQNMLILHSSNANVAFRFANNRIESCAVANAGIGYSNSDVMVFQGYEYIANVVIGGANGYANIVTSNTGGIVNVNMSSYGTGFVNGFAVTIANSAGGPTAGHGFMPSVIPNSTIFVEHQYDGTAGLYVNCNMINLDVHDVLPADFVENPLGTFYNMYHTLNFYKVAANTHSGVAYLYDSDPSQNDVYPIKPTCNAGHSYSKQRCHMSWSNECALMGYTNTIQSNSTCVTVNAVANGDFTHICTDDGSVTFSQFIINNDYTNEHTNYGNALAKGVSTKVTFANDHYAEDLRVYVTAYKPVGTDVQMYARIYNTHDGDSFDDKDWTRLQLIDGIGLYSSQADANSYIELTYGFQSCPNIAYTLPGTATITLNSANIVGSATTWQTGASANLHVGDLVKITQPLFPNNNIVTLVTAVANDTFFTVSDPISNNGLVGPGLSVQKIGFPNQAFNNPLNENVVRYYSSSMAYYDTFNVMQFKPVLLSSNTCLIPHLDDIRAVGVSS